MRLWPLTFVSALGELDILWGSRRPRVGPWHSCHRMIEGGTWDQQELDPEVFGSSIDAFPNTWSFSLWADNPLLPAGYDNPKTVVNKPVITVFLFHGQQNTDRNVSPLALTLVSRFHERVAQHDLPFNVAIWAVRIPDSPAAFQDSIVYQQAHFMHLALKQIAKRNIHQRTFYVNPNGVQITPQERGYIPVFLEAQSMGGLSVATLLFDRILAPGRESDVFQVVSFFGLNAAINDHPLPWNLSAVAMVKQLQRRQKDLAFRLEAELSASGGEPHASVTRVLHEHIFPFVSFFLQGGPLDEQIPPTIARFPTSIFSQQTDFSRLDDTWQGPAGVGKPVQRLGLWDATFLRIVPSLTTVRRAYGHNEVMSCRESLFEGFAVPWVELWMLVDSTLRSNMPLISILAVGETLPAIHTVSAARIADIELALYRLVLSSEKSDRSVNAFSILNEVISVKEVHREMHNKGRSGGAEPHNKGRSGGAEPHNKGRSDGAEPHKLSDTSDIDGSAKRHLRRFPEMSAYRPFKTVFRTTNLNCLQKACKIPVKEAASMVLLTFLDSNSVSNVEFQDKPVRVACAPNTSGLCLALVPTFDEVGTLSVGPGVQSQMFSVAVGDAPRTVTFDPFSRVLPLCHQLLFLLGISKVQMEIPKSDSPATHVRLLQVPSWLSPDATVGYTSVGAHPPLLVAFSSDWEHIIWGETEVGASRTHVLLDLDVSTSVKDDKALHLMAILLHDGDIRLTLEPDLLSALFVSGRAYGIGVLSAVVAHQFLLLYLFEIREERAKRRPITRMLQTPLGSVLAAASVLTVTCYLFPFQSMDSPFHYSPMETSLLVALLGWGCSEAFRTTSRLIRLAGSWVLPYVRSLQRVTRPTLPPRSLDYLLVLLFPIPTGLLYLLPRSLFYVFPFVRMLAAEEESNRLTHLLLCLDIATVGFALMLLFNLPSVLFFKLMTPRPGFLATGLMTPFANSLLVGGVPRSVLLCSFLQVLPFLLYSRFTRKVTAKMGQFEILLFGWMTDHPHYPPALFCLFVLAFLFTR